MAVNQGQLRMRHVMKMQRDMMTFIYEKQQDRIEDRMNDLAKENASILGEGCNETFMFEGHFYGITENQNGLKNKVLHPSLFKQAHDIIHGAPFSDLEEHAQIAQFLGTVLSESKHNRDLISLLPNAFLSVVELDPEIFDTGDPMEEEKLLNIKESNREALLHLNRLFITRLLLSD